VFTRAGAWPAGPGAALLRPLAPFRKHDPHRHHQQGIRPKAGLTASLLSSGGTFINIISQLIAGTAVIAVVAPSLGLVPALLITAAFMALYVIGGGVHGAGLVGILKLALLYVSMIGCGIMVLHLTGGLGGFRSLVSTIDNPDGVRFGSLFARGISKDGAPASP
jgi:SSS family solute:Na+ symporter